MVAIAALALVFWALVHLLFAQGCFSIGMWHQGILSIIAAAAIIVSAYRLVKAKPFARLLLLGTLPLLFLHIYYTLVMNDESRVFVAASTVAPLMGALLMQGSVSVGIKKRVVYSSLIVIATALTWLVSSLLRS